MELWRKAKRLTVAGILDLRNTRIKELRDNLTVDENFYLAGTNTKKLPDNLTVHGDLVLSHTPIKKLPENLTVDGDLALTGTKIKGLPNSLIVGGDLYLIGTSITNYPVIYGCGRLGREIYLSLTDKSIIVIGCFKGTEEEAIERIKGEYSGSAADDYILKVKRCFSMYEELQENNILN